MPEPSQTYANHTRNRPLYLVVYFVFFVNLYWTAYRVVKAPSADTMLGVSMAIALVLLSWYARVFALTVQDRVIRLEMRLRMRELLPEAMHSRINDFTKRQLVALRFASDAELPGLADKVLRDNIQDVKTIKQMITDWQGDFLRA